MDLSELKIPIASSQNRCKVIMTDRSKSYRRVKNANQEGTKSFELSTLTETEPWIFFQKKVGKIFNSIGGEILRLAKSIASRCGGFPLALEIIVMENYFET